MDLAIRKLVRNGLVRHQKSSIGECLLLVKYVTIVSFFPLPFQRRSKIAEIHPSPRSTP